MPDKMKSEDAVPQADKQHSTRVAERAGRDGAQAAEINKEAAEKRQQGETGKEGQQPGQSFHRGG